MCLVSKALVVKKEEGGLSSLDRIVSNLDAQKNDQIYCNKENEFDFRLVRLEKERGRKRKTRARFFLSG